MSDTYDKCQLCGDVFFPTVSRHPMCSDCSAARIRELEREVDGMHAAYMERYERLASDYAAQAAEIKRLKSDPDIAANIKMHADEAAKAWEPELKAARAEVERLKSDHPRQVEFAFQEGWCLYGSMVATKSDKTISHYWDNSDVKAALQREPWAVEPDQDSVSVDPIGG